MAKPKRWRALVGGAVTEIIIRGQPRPLAGRWITFRAEQQGSEWLVGKVAEVLGDGTLSILLLPDPTDVPLDKFLQTMLKPK